MSAPLELTSRDGRHTAEVDTAARMVLLVDPDGDVLPVAFAELAPLGKLLIEAHVLTGRLSK